MQKQAERLKKTRGINIAENNLATNSLKYVVTAVEGKEGNFITDRQALARRAIISQQGTLMHCESSCDSASLTWTWDTG